MASTAKPTPPTTSTSSSAPRPTPFTRPVTKPVTKPVATVASTPKTEERAPSTEADTGDDKKRRALWISLSVAAVVLAVGVPILCNVCGAGEEEKEEEEEKKVASSGAVLNKLVNWVKELTEGDHEEAEHDEEEEDTEASKYVEIDSVMDFATTQSM